MLLAEVLREVADLLLRLVRQTSVLTEVDLFSGRQLFNVPSEEVRRAHTQGPSQPSEHSERWFAFTAFHLRNRGLGGVQSAGKAALGQPRVGSNFLQPPAEIVHGHGSRWKRRVVNILTPIAYTTYYSRCLNVSLNVLR